MAAIDRHSSFSPSASGPAVKLRAVTPNDDVELDYVSSGLLIGGAGAVSVLASEDSAPVTISVQAGAILPIRVRKVLSSGTTATGIVALVS